MSQDRAFLESLSDRDLLTLSPVATGCQVIPHPREQEFLDLPDEEVMFGGAVGGGKLSPLDSKVLTPKGFVLLGEVKRGSQVINPTTGGSSRVIGVFPQGVMPIWRLTFDDGASLEVGADHLWAYKKAGNRWGRTEGKGYRESGELLGRLDLMDRWSKYRVGTTSDLIKRHESGQGIRIPLMEPAAFTVNGRTGGVDPYLIGVMLGDGSCAGLVVTSCDDEVRDYLLRHGFSPHNELHTDGKPKSYGATGETRRALKAWLSNHGLKKARSWEKFIPSYVFTASIPYRLHVLQGLMDTDGTADERGRVYFTSTSQELAKGVQELVRSLGGKARLREKSSCYSYKGKRLQGRDAYTIRCWLPRLSSLFRIRRKANRASDSWNGGHEITRELVSIEYVGEKESQCIKVDNPYGLYVADDYIVTHNTEALLLWLLEGVQYPNFSGLFLRRTFAQLQGSPTSPIERSWKFFQPSGGVYNAGAKLWKWANGAMVRFGHMQHEQDKHNYDGPEFHRIAWDQIEQFSESQYTYMFSRLRRTVGFPIGCGMRSTANPVGGNWVKQRFVTADAMAELSKYTAYDPSPPGMVFDSPCGAKFVPSRIADNPSIEIDEYIERLRSKLGGVLAAKLANGDWSAVEGAVIDPDDLRYFTTTGEKLWLGDTGIQSSRKARFVTVDTAGTSKQKAAESRGKEPSWSVCGIWDYCPAGLCLRHIWRDRVGWPELRDAVQQVVKEWGNPPVYVENAHHGPVLAAEIGAKLINTRLPGMGGGVSEGAKYDRAVASGLLKRIANHTFWLPDSSSVEGAAGWMPEFESELLGWTGHPDQTADQIDVCSYAAYHVDSRRTSWGGVIDNRTVSMARRW